MKENLSSYTECPRCEKKEFVHCTGSDDFKIKYECHRCNATFDILKAPEPLSNVPLGTSPEPSSPEKSAFDRQVGGNHYSKLAIQPAKYSFKNNMNWHQGEIIKYVTRYKDKGLKKDLDKARHLIDQLIELEYGDEQS